MLQRLRRLDLQVRVVMILAIVLAATFLVVTIAANRLTEPYLEEEVRQLGLTTARSFAQDLIQDRVLSRPNAAELVEAKIRDGILAQPHLIQFEVFVSDPKTSATRLLAASYEEIVPYDHTATVIVEEAVSERATESGIPIFEISVPLLSKKELSKNIKPGGMVRLQISLKIVGEILGVIQRISMIAAVVSFFILFFVLSFMLRRTIANDRLLQRTRTQNSQLYEQLHEAQRELMNREKLAVMGQLTANFAHEIGTPLNAIGGHLQLLKEELEPKNGNARIGVLEGQVSKIAQIVREFLQTTAKPASLPQLVDSHPLIEKTLALVSPRIRSLGVEVRTQFDRTIGPVRVVPVDLEQILLNLANNALDALEEKKHASPDARLQLVVSTRVRKEGPNQKAEILVRDTGVGIPDADLRLAWKPFYSTKAPGKGTGLGLTISQQLVKKYGGQMSLQSKQGEWTEVQITLPYSKLENHVAAAPI